MIRLEIILIAVLATVGSYSQAQSPIGIWVNYHPEKDTPLSYVEFYKNEGKLNARILKILDPDIENLCSKCKGDRKDKNLNGMTIVWNLTRKNDTHYKNGRILDPGNGKIYKCTVKMYPNNLLKIHGYLGIRVLGKSQYWYRIPEDEHLATVNSTLNRHQVN